MRRIDAERGRLDVLVNDIWGGERLFEWDAPVWEHDLSKGLRLLRLAIGTHLITGHSTLLLSGPLAGGRDTYVEVQRRPLRLAAFYDRLRRVKPGSKPSPGREIAPTAARRRADAADVIRFDMTNRR